MILTPETMSASARATTLDLEATGYKYDDATRSWRWPDGQPVPRAAMRHKGLESRLAPAAPPTSRVVDDEEAMAQRLMPSGGGRSVRQILGLAAEDPPPDFTVERAARVREHERFIADQVAANAGVDAWFARLGFADPVEHDDARDHHDAGGDLWSAVQERAARSTRATHDGGVSGPSGIAYGEPAQPLDATGSTQTEAERRQGVRDAFGAYTLTDAQVTEALRLIDEMMNNPGPAAATAWSNFVASLTLTPADGRNPLAVDNH